MNLITKLKHRPKKVLGVDASTKSIAFCYMVNGVPECWGELSIECGTAADKYGHAARIAKFFHQFDFDVLSYEPAVFVNNKSTVISLAYIYGAILSEVAYGVGELLTPRPTEWQSKIGNGALTKQEKENIIKSYPEKSKSWYTTQYRLARKDKTRMWVKSEFGIDIKSDNVSDSFGIAWFAA